MKVGQNVIVFNSIEWSKTGDKPDGNEVYWQKAKILKFRHNKGEQIADVEFESGLKSNGHFVRCIKI